MIARVRQVVLEVIEEQVARGSRIYESGHFVVLVWGNSQRDLEAVERILSQARRFRPLRMPSQPTSGLSSAKAEGQSSVQCDSMHCVCGVAACTAQPVTA